MGRVQRHLFIGTDGAPCAADGLSVKWSFDERVNDGLYCANSLKIGREIIEDPAAGVAL
jgi:hypothetical protein